MPTIPTNEDNARFRLLPRDSRRYKKPTSREIDKVPIRCLGLASTVGWGAYGIADIDPIKMVSERVLRWELGVGTQRRGSSYTIKFSRRQEQP